jgi:hypothetical protein
MAVNYHPNKMTSAERVVLFDIDLLKLAGEYKLDPTPKLERDLHTALCAKGFERRPDRERLIDRLVRAQAGTHIRKG